MPATCVSSGGANGEYAKPDGTLFSLPTRVLFAAASSPDGGQPAVVDLSLDQVTPPAVSPGCAGLGDGVDSDWIKTVRVTSSLLSTFWGRDVELEACVLVPLDWDSSNDARFPLVVAHGHYSPLFFSGGGFQEVEPTCDVDVDGYECVQEQYNFYLYKNWTSTDPEVSKFVGARMIVMTINHPVPLFDDSYAVNSASLGPYGDAILTELIPEVRVSESLLGPLLGSCSASSRLAMAPRRLVPPPGGEPLPRRWGGLGAGAVRRQHGGLGDRCVAGPLPR